jgi:hypothetical protein
MAIRRDAGRVVDGDPASTATRVPAPLLQTTILDGADFVAARAARSSLVGMRLHEGRSLWCRLSADATFGAVVAAVVGAVGAERLSAAAGRGVARAAGGGSWTHDTTDSPATTAVGAFLERAPAVLGAVVLGGDRTKVIAGAGTKALDRDACVAVAQRRAGTFGHSWHVAAEERDEELASIGFYLRTLVSGEPDFWCFGAELELEHATTLWMFVDRGSSQGLGWACLAALTRSLANVVSGGGGAVR